MWYGCQQVADGRSLSAEAARAAAKGRVWSGADALRLGLVDRLGGLQDAVAWARAAVPGPLVPFPFAPLIYPPPPPLPSPGPSYQEVG